MDDKKFPFSKYHALGNDYIVIDPYYNKTAVNGEAVRLLCHRNYGIGGDGVLCGPIAFDGMFGVKIFNPDGSEAEKSGNGIRIFSKYLRDERYVLPQAEFTLNTLGGVVSVRLLDYEADSIEVNMGKATFWSDEIPVAGPRRQVLHEKLDLDGRDLRVTCVSVGNPHCVVPMPDVISQALACEIGPAIETHPNFPNRVNVQFMKVIDKSTIEIEIWERGAGYTLASGTSSCAAASAAYALELTGPSVTVKMPGGKLDVNIKEDGDIFITGSVNGVYSGDFHENLIEGLKKIGVIE
ncbi:MAG: diaminopimelate epimerase [Clostridiales bacterium]|nr:diaminopimelate epimerase [Clostridiales bacterium]